jgi:hypothetical protein
MQEGWRSIFLGSLEPIEEWIDAESARYLAEYVLEELVDPALEQLAQSRAGDEDVQLAGRALNAAIFLAVYRARTYPRSHAGLIAAGPPFVREQLREILAGICPLWPIC